MSLRSAYQLIVETINRGSMQRRDVSNLPKVIGNHSTAAANGDKYYIAAELRADSLPQKFVVGDAKTYNGYENAPLLPGGVYEIHVRAVTVNENGVSDNSSIDNSASCVVNNSKSCKDSGKLKK